MEELLDLMPAAKAVYVKASDPTSHLFVATALRGAITQAAQGAHRTCKRNSEFGHRHSEKELHVIVGHGPGARGSLTVALLSGGALLPKR